MAPYLGRLIIRFGPLLNRSPSRTTLTSLRTILYSESCVSSSVPSTAIPTPHFTCTIAYIVLSHDQRFHFKFPKTFVLVTMYCDGPLTICSKQNTRCIYRRTASYFQIFTYQSMTSSLWSVQVNQFTLLSKSSPEKKHI